MSEAIQTTAQAGSAAYDALLQMEDHMISLECAAHLMTWLGVAERNADLSGADNLNGRTKHEALHFVSQALTAITNELRHQHEAACTAVGELQAAATPKTV